MAWESQAGPVVPEVPEAAGVFSRWTHPPPWGTWGPSVRQAQMSARLARLAAALGLAAPPREQQPRVQRHLAIPWAPHARPQRGRAPGPCAEREAGGLTRGCPTRVSHPGARPPPRPAASDAEELLPRAGLGSSCTYITPSCRSGGKGGAGTAAKAPVPGPHGEQRTHPAGKEQERGFPSALGGCSELAPWVKGEAGHCPQLGLPGSEPSTWAAGWTLSDRACGPEVTDAGTAG